MTRVKTVVGYLCKMKHGKIRFQGKLPPGEHYGRENSIYSNVTEIVPHDAPPPKGLPVIITTYVAENQYHDLTTGKLVTGIIHLLNQTVIDYFTKKQPVVKTATYGSEFMAARTAT